MNLANLKGSIRAAQYSAGPRAHAWIETMRWVPSARRAADARSPWSGTAPAQAPVRVLIAPANFAGQAHAWASALTSARPDIVAQTWTHTGTAGFDFPSTHRTPRESAGLSRAWQREVFDDVSRHFTHVMLESGRPLFGRLFGFEVLAEAEALRERGVNVSMLWHGTDIRRPLVEREHNPASPFWDAHKKGHIRALEARAQRNGHIAAAWDGPQFFTTPDLAEHVPHGTWVPVVVPQSPWRELDAPPWVAPLRVLHLPSNPWIKNSAPLRAAAAAAPDVAWNFAARMPSAEVPAAVEGADVVADQFGLHLYGVAAVEAMHAGRAVVSLAGAPLRDAVQRFTGEDLPVAACEASQVPELITQWQADGSQARELAERGREFAARWHTGTQTAERLVEAWGLDD
ncbi:hypothetical protein ON058_02690 [Demequina sp. B12]|uniref:glycosyltransferase n=1 Tax=Demequina sp. B12 TaxID=2992757 RepID=UPI00237C3F8E|nr:hypothetical protein [Demequina sp. B12]MDE0572317.1 hypothetical protein [Demequina sp. B12]